MSDGGKLLVGGFVFELAVQLPDGVGFGGNRVLEVVGLAQLEALHDSLDRFDVVNDDQIGRVFDRDEGELHQGYYRRGAVAGTARREVQTLPDVGRVGLPGIVNREVFQRVVGSVVGVEEDLPLGRVFSYPLNTADVASSRTEGRTERDGDAFRPSAVEVVGAQGLVAIVEAIDRESLADVLRGGRVSPNKPPVAKYGVVGGGPAFVECGEVPVAVPEFGMVALGIHELIPEVVQGHHALAATRPRPPAPVQLSDLADVARPDDATPAHAGLHGHDGPWPVTPAQQAADSFVHDVGEIGGSRVDASDLGDRRGLDVVVGEHRSRGQDDGPSAARAAVVEVGDFNGSKSGLSVESHFIQQQVIDGS